MDTSTGTYDRETVRHELMRALDDVRGVIADCADEAERTGFYPERGWRAMHASGLFRMKAPAACS